MLGAGTLINPIVKVVTTVAILAAVSVFVIKPIVSTSEKVSDAAQERSDKAAREAEARAEKVQLDVARTIALSAAQSARAVGDGPRAERILACVKDAETSDDMDFCRAL